MEKLIRKRIVDHMNMFDLFSKRQFGLMGGPSTSAATESTGQINGLVC